MAKTNIEWVNQPGTMPESWNFIGGCSPISSGCQSCYGARMAATRLKDIPLYSECAELDATGKAQWTRDRINFDLDKLQLPLHWRKSRTVFVCSISDLFHKGVPSDIIIHAYEVMAACLQHTFIVCTKRPERIVPVLYNEGIGYLGGGDYLPNVWHLVSVENQEQANIRIPELLKLWNASPGWPVLGVSVEPMLEKINLRKYLVGPCWKCGHEHWNTGGALGRHCCRCDADAYYPGLSWIIASCETGPNARPMELSWARELRDQCQAAGVPFFMNFHEVGQRHTRTAAPA